MDVRAGLDELGGHAQRLRRRVGVLETAGVGHDRDVERLGDVGRQLDAQLLEEVAEDLSRRGRRSDDHVDVAEAAVVVVMVDVDHERRALEHGRIGPDPARVRAVEREDDSLGGVVRGAARDPVERHEVVLAGKRRLPGEVHDGVLAELLEGELHGEDRPERVAVGVLVGRDEEAVVSRGSASATFRRSAVPFVFVWRELIDEP